MFQLVNINLPQIHRQTIHVFIASFDCALACTRQTTEPGTSHLRSRNAAMPNTELVPSLGRATSSAVCPSWGEDMSRRFAVGSPNPKQWDPVIEK